MPGVFQLSLDNLKEEIEEVKSLGIKAVLLFGVPKDKDAEGTGAYCSDGIVQQATKLIKKTFPEILVIADTCLCEYTSHGHCGVISDGEVDNDASLALLAKTAVSQAEAGADIIAPSNMMDGFVQAIRKALDDAGFLPFNCHMSAAVKSCFGILSVMCSVQGSTPEFGDRKAYQMDPANRMEALREAESDVAEGADMLIVKPSLAYLDIIRDVKYYSIPQ